MKDSDSIRRSKKKTNGRTVGKLSSCSTNKSNETSVSKSDKRRAKTAKAIMGGSNSKHKTKASNSTTKSIPRKGSKQSPELRPKRRASQTYFFKYQLAKNPLKAEEEDLKLALLASLQQCSNGVSDGDTKSSACEKPSTPEKRSKQPNNNTNNNNNCTNNANNISTNNINNTKESVHLASESERPVDYLKKYKPETEDFLTFICFRTTPLNHCTTSPNKATTLNNNISSSNNDVTNTNNINKIATVNINSPTIMDQHSPNNQRRPTRQSPRLASSNRKISENDSLNQTLGTSTTAYDNSITYEEDMKRASIALEDMAQEINSSDDINNEVAQDFPDCISKSSSSPYKNNKHLVKGLMTREFAGAFADEETIFESISNHKL